MKKKLILLMLIILAISGCANIFKTSLENLQTLLDSGDYAAILTAANNILSTDPNNVEALIARGQAQAALEGVIFTDMMTKLNEASKSGEDEDISDLFNDIAGSASTSNLLDACQDLNKANALSNLSNDDKLAVAMINGATAQKLHDELWSVDDDTKIVTPVPTGNATYKGNLERDVKGEDGQYFSGDASVDLTDSVSNLLWAFENSATDSGALDQEQENELTDIEETNERKIAMQKAIDGVATAGTYNQSANTYIDNNGVVHNMTNPSEALLKQVIEDAYFN